MDTFTELRQLADDLTELGDAATAMPVHEAIDRFSAWSRSTYFNTCALAIAHDRAAPPGGLWSR